MLNKIIANCPTEISTFLKKKTFKKGEMIILQQDNDSYIFLLISGTAKSYYISPNGLEYTMLSMAKNEILGEVEILLNIKAISMVQAQSDCEVLLLKKSKFLQWVKLDSDFSMFVMKSLANKLYSLSEYTYKHINSTVDERLLQLLQISIIKNDLSLHKKDIQDKILTTKRSVNRALKKMVDKDLLLIESDIVKINNVSKLNSYIQGKLY